MTPWQKLKSDGFVNLGVLSPELDTLSLAKEIGTVIQIQGLSTVQSLSPRSKVDFPKNTYSGNYGRETFPLHTDLAHWHQPPRYFLLRCITPDPDVGTLILPFRKALTNISSSTKLRAIFRPRRRVENKMFFLRFIQDEVCRWDPLFIKPENQEAEEVSSMLHDYKNDGVDHLILSRPAQTLIIDNWKVLHGRTDVKNKKSTRLVERVYLSEIYK